jgi:hypothetical protein
VRHACLDAYRGCADALDDVLREMDAEAPTRNDLILAAAVCRVATTALQEEEPHIAARIVEYSVEACRRCGEVAAALDHGSASRLADLCDACVESATMLLLSGWLR